MTKLDRTQIQQRLTDLVDWRLDEHPLSLTKEWLFEGFDEAVVFINLIAYLATEEDHHPEIWNCYNQLRVRLWTHSESGLTEKDFALAKAINELPTE